LNYYRFSWVALSVERSLTQLNSISPYYACYNSYTEANWKYSHPVPVFYTRTGRKMGKNEMEIALESTNSVVLKHGISQNDPE